MTTRYECELRNLDRAYTAALSLDVRTLTKMIEAGSELPLISVGSGGSFSTGSFAAILHEYVTGKVGCPVTPLEFLDHDRIDAGVAFFSASGKNKDICNAFKAAALREYRPGWALVLSENTAMHAITNRFQYLDIASYSDASFRDGFLAVSSLLISSILLIRSYEILAGWTTCLPDTLEELAQTTLGKNEFMWIIDATFDVATREIISVLYTPKMKPAAIDLESRFVEAALGSLHSADLRNFGHGRHFWLAKHAENTGVLALIGKGHDRLADRTIALLPKETQIVRINIHGPELLQILAGILVGLYFTAAGGRVAKIDPSRPGVPDFGRKIYKLNSNGMNNNQSNLNRAAAIRRKVDSSRDYVTDWNEAWLEVSDRIRTTPIQGIVLDYDGTISDSRKRYDPLPYSMRKALAYTLSLGLVIGIATGRGPSAGVALREAFPEERWDEVVVGYYNGSIVTTLADQSDPITNGHCDKEILTALSTSPMFQGLKVRENDKQISIRLKTGQSALEATQEAKCIITNMGHQGDVLISSHSIDIIFGSVSKQSVVESVKSYLSNGSGVILRIGDKGRPNGNDAKLLDHLYGLSVDEVSGSRDHCWNLSPAGILGSQATLYYLNALKKDGDNIYLAMGKSDRGYVNAS